MPRALSGLAAAALSSILLVGALVVGFGTGLAPMVLDVERATAGGSSSSGARARVPLPEALTSLAVERGAGPVPSGAGGRVVLIDQLHAIVPQVESSWVGFQGGSSLKFDDAEIGSFVTVGFLSMTSDETASDLVSTVAGFDGRQKVAADGQGLEQLEVFTFQGRSDERFTSVVARQAGFVVAVTVDGQADGATTGRMVALAAAAFEALGFR